jgi:hypothetical protein
MSKVQTDVSRGVKCVNKDMNKYLICTIQASVMKDMEKMCCNCRHQNEDSGTCIEIDQVRMFNLDSSLFSIVPTCKDCKHEKDRGPIICPKSLSALFISIG